MSRQNAAPTGTRRDGARQTGSPARRRPVRSSIAILTLAGAAALPAASANAHGTSPHAKDPLGAAGPTVGHAREHEAIDELIGKIRKMSAKERGALQRRALGTGTSGSAIAKRLADKPVGPASEFGQWSAPFKAPTYGIHGVLLPTGRVLVMSMGHGHAAGLPGSNMGQDVNNDGAAALWDPALGTGTNAFKQIDPPPIPLDDPQKRRGYKNLRPAPVYCSGHVQLADGRILVAGGNLEAGGGGFGLKLLYLFDPWTEQWVRQQDLGVARWYPTLTRLPNGKVAILAGRDEKGVNRPEVELYPAAGQSIPGIDTSTLPPAPSKTEIKTKRDNIRSFYPHTYVTRNGKLAVVGPTQPDQGILDLNSWTWTNTIGFRQGSNGYASSFPEPNTVDGPERIFAVGGLSTGGHLQPLVSSIRPGIDTRWTDGPALKLSRRNAPTVLLPDGSVVAVGGGAKELREVNPMAAWPTRRQPELWDPTTKQWKLGPAQARPRGYHSIAMLLPDGRVLSAGDDLQSAAFDDNLKDAYDTTFELYSPPYLFKGPRPVVTSAPAKASYGQTIDLELDGDASQIARVTVVAPGSNTHALDMNQRQLELRIVGRSGNTITVLAPPTAAAAPPGDYMIFALSDQGVPSVGKFVQVLPLGAPGHPQSSGPAWGSSGPGTGEPEPEPTNPQPTNPQPTNPQTTTPTNPPVKAPRPWWWPIFLPWNG